MKTRSGRPLTEEEIRRLADRAEGGLEIEAWKPRRGRPPLDAASPGHAPRVVARVSASLYARATARAASEGRTISEVIRDLLEAYAGEPAR
jgi:hypothetical protein